MIYGHIMTFVLRVKEDC